MTVKSWHRPDRPGSPPTVCRMGAAGGMAAEVEVTARNEAAADFEQVRLLRRSSPGQRIGALLDAHELLTGPL